MPTPSLKKEEEKFLSFFSNKVGIKPVFLFNSKKNKTAFALENGDNHRLALDFREQQNEKDYRGYAWSSSLNNYLVYNNKLLLMR